MISRTMLMAGAAFAAISFGVSAQAAVTDTNSLTAWSTATGDHTPLSISLGDLVPPGSVTFSGATAGAAISPAGLAEGGKYWSNGWADHGTGAIATDDVIKIGNQSATANMVTLNLTGLSALGFFMQVNGAGTYSISTCALPNGRACTIDTDPAMTDAGGTAQTGGIFFGYYGDPLGNVKSITVTLNPAGNDSANPTTALVVGQFYEVPISVPEPATLGVLGFGLAALGIARRRKRA